MRLFALLGVVARRRTTGGGGGGGEEDPDWPGVASPPVANALILEQQDELAPLIYASDGADGWLTVD